MRLLSLALSTLFLTTTTLAPGTHASLDFKAMLFGNNQDEENVDFGFPAASRHRPPVDCDQYVCQDTLACVAHPIDCPCPYIHDSKCMNDDWYTCVRGSCDQLSLD
ncbi:hypothetical protein O0I10_001327 [Lichtheimia ornata]|uniref:Long chronological lifespan protein 2 n=1 Tax=Lichtheimia ornata TaxID=688661 RepID=A0AAD8DHX3_9FUNG|nr:uncharacterized protein O0I10_001327 [Lichtheimia ornata]KAJ8663150.1 hypothetical protein O0I10_001327 [Lichtheimia ornata]